MADVIMTPEFRVSFPNVFKPRKAEGSDKEKYSLSMLFPADADLSTLKKAAAEAVKEKWGDKPPKALKSPFLDAGNYEYDGYEEGMILIRASSIQRPGVIDGRKNRIEDDEDFYPGCYARATLRAFAYDNSGNKGVSFGLQNIQKLRDGERIGGRRKAEDEFEAVAGAAEGDSADSLFA